MMKKWFWLVALVWFGLSCYGLFWRVPSGSAPAIHHVDKVAHGLMFFGQFYLLGSLWQINSKTKVVGLWLVALLWAVLSELIQGYFTLRTMDFWDGVADMVGASVAVAYWWYRSGAKA